MNKLKEAHKNQDVNAVDTALAEMNNAWTAASEEIYKAQQAGAGAAGAQQGSNGSANQGANAGDTVTDAEFEEVK